MLDRVVVIPGRPRTEYVTREIHEHRAPTDESIKILREMEQAADAKRVAAMQMPGNLFNGVVEIWGNHADALTHAVAIFDINGRRCTAKAKIDYHAEDKTRLLTDLHEATAKAIASEVLIEMTRGIKLPR